MVSIRQIKSALAGVLLVYAGFALAGATGDSQSPTNQQQKVKVKTMSSITVNSDGDATSQFEGISADAAAAGLDTMILHGSVASESVREGTNRVKIDWHTLERQKLGNSTRQMLENPLRSSVLVEAEEIPPQTIMTASGDLDSVISSFNTIIERENNQGEDEQTNEDETEKRSLSDGGGRLDTGPSSTLGDSDDAFNDDEMGPNSNLLSERQEMCDFRVDIPGLQMFKQVRTDTVDETGTVTETGDCADTGEPIPLQKQYGGDCSVMPDLENGVVYQSYRVVSTLDGITQILQDCKIDTQDNMLEVKATTSDCGVTHDFNNGVTIQQERLFYLGEDGETPVRGCDDSDIEYEQFVTTASCEPIVDMENGMVIPQSQVGYKNNKGETFYATDCAAMSNNSGIAIQSEACASPKYEHDFTNGQSYALKRQYYNDHNTGEKKYLTSCGRSDESYPHLEFTESCDVNNDDKNMRTEIMAITAIDTPDGQVEISPCAVTDTSSYIYDGYDMKEYDTFPSGVLAYQTCESNGMWNECTPMQFEWKSGNSQLIKGNPWNDRNANTCGTYADGNSNAYIARNCTFTRVKMVARKKYIRYDGSIFRKWDTSIYSQKVARVP